MASQIEIKPIKTSQLQVPLIGTAPLIVHKWSEKARKQMLDKQQGKRSAREARDPQAEYEATLYRTEHGDYGFPVLAFKAATVRGGKLAGVKMTDARQLITVTGDVSDDLTMQLAVLEGEPRMREDVVRIGMGTEPRFRGEFPEWRTVLHVQFFPGLISLDSVLNLIKFGGQTVGIGDWRPERNGQNGTYDIDDSRDLVVID